MLVVTARLFKDNQLVGYRLSDGQSTQDLTKQQVWVYAKNKQIINVIATGTEIEPVISGTNGFELKLLPQIKWNENKESEKYDAQDILAAYIDRICVSNATVLKEMIDVETNQEYKQRLREAQITALKERVKNNNLKERRLWKDDAIIENILYVGGHAVGYTLKNISTHSIGVYKMPIGQERRKQLVELKPNCSIEMSKAETALTLSQQQFSGRINDCKLVSPSLKNQRIGVYEWLNNFYILSSEKELPAKILEVNEYTKTYIVNESMINKYIDGRTIEVGLIESFADLADAAEIDSTDIRNAAQNIQEAQSNQVKQTIQKLNNTKTIKGMFDAFKR